MRPFAPLLLPCLLLLCLPLARPALAQDSDAPTGDSDNTALPAARDRKFGHLTIDDGVSNNHVNVIFQDSRGFLWFGTADGLNKYDGYRITVYRHDPADSAGLAGNYIWTITEDRTGRLWIGTNGAGLDCFDPVSETFYHYRHNPADTHSLSSRYNYINALLCDADGRLWVGTSNGLNRLDQLPPKDQPDAARFKRYLPDRQNPAGLSHQTVSVLYQTRDGQLWIGTRGGLERWNPETDGFEHWRHDPANPNSLNDNQISAIGEDQAGRLWLGTWRAGLNMLDRATGRVTRYAADPTTPGGLSSNLIRDIQTDPSGGLWIGTDGGGLNRRDPQTGVFTVYRPDPTDPAGLGDKTVFAIYPDRSGLLWLGTRNSGLSVLDSRPTRFRHYRHDPQDNNSLISNQIYTVAEDSTGTGAMWIATWNGLNRLVPDSGLVQRYPLKFTITAMTPNTSGAWWLGSATSGLNLWQPVTGILQQYRHDPNDPTSLSDDRIQCLYRDRRQRLWIGTKNGLSLWQPAQRNFRFFQPDSDGKTYVNCLTEDAGGTLWVSTTEGLFRMNWPDFTPADSVRFRQYRAQPGGLSSDVIHCLHEDRAGRLWLGTDAGLNCLDYRSETFTVYTVKDGLPNDVIRGILEDQQGRLWLSTNNGLSCFNPGQKTFKNYDARDGLQSNQFSKYSYYQSRAGVMYFGGINGLTAFRPEDITDNPYLPPVVLTDFKIFNKSVSIGPDSPLPQHINLAKSITLSYQQSVFSLDFAALNYIVPTKNQYAYKMEGFDKDWNYAGADRRFATYTNLDPGDYTFRVKGSNNDDLWNEQGTAVNITITPPWWKTWWAYTIYALFFLTSGPSIYFWRINQLKQRQRELESQVTQRTAELSNANEKLIVLDGFKQSMMGMIVHDLKNPLNAIMSALNSRAVESQLEMLRQSSKQMLTMVMNILDVQKFEDTKMILEKQDQVLVEIVENAVRQVTFLSQRKNITITNMIGPEVTVKADAEMIERVVVNLLTNGIKYTPNNGQINLTGLEDLLGFVRIEVTDSGEGIPADKLSTVFEKFGQVKAKSSGNVRSTGIGLTFCKLAVEAHGGEIGVKSIVEQGTTFYFTLPAGQKSTAATHAEHRMSEKPTRSWALSTDDKAALKPLLAVLQTLDVYETSHIEKILAQLEPADSESIRLWKAEMQNTLYALNEEKYTELLTLIA